MKILQIGASYTGAQEKIQCSIHQYLEDNGYESYILYAYGSSDDKHIIKYESRIANFLRRILWKYMGKKPDCAILSTIQLIKKINKIQPDIIHLHILHHGYIDYIWLFKYLAKKNIPIVYTMHDMWAFTGGCYHYNDVQCNNFTNGCNECPKDTFSLDCIAQSTSHYLNLKMNLFTKLRKIVFVAVSDWVSEEVKKSKLNEYQIYTVWNALDSKIYKEINTSLNIKSETIFPSNRLFKIIGVANTWTERKGIKKFIELANMLGKGYHIVLVGNASKKIQENSPSNITYVGLENDKKKLASYYAQADIHISMSTEETFGYTFVEAAFSGTKSIGFDSTAIPGILNKVKGFIVKKNNLYAVADLVRELQRERLLCKLTDNEKEEIYKDFSPKIMAEKYCQIYLSLR